MRVTVPTRRATPGENDATNKDPACSRIRASDELPCTVRQVLGRIAVGDDVTPPAFGDAFLAAVHLPAPTRDVILGSLMTAVMTRGPLPADVASMLGAALGIDTRTTAEKISGSERPVLLLAGSGKKGVRTLNVSTPAALVAAAAGALVIKIGSSATSSALGSRDLVRSLGLPERRTADAVRADLAACGFAFVAVEPTIPILDGLYGGRFHTPNPFSFGLAPLVSPVLGDITVFGLSHPHVDVAARVLTSFGFRDIDVFSTRLPSGHYIDEIGPDGELRWCTVRNGMAGPTEIRRTTAVEPRSEPQHLPPPLAADETAAQTVQLLCGGGSAAHRAFVVLNAAHLLVIGKVTASIAEATANAEEVLRCGAVLSRIQAATAAGAAR